MDFEAWMGRVDSEVQRRAGVSVHALADYTFRDAFAAGAEPEAVAADAIENDGGGSWGWPWGEPIYSYSRAQAIADGVLVDVSSMAREAGLKYPTVVTRAVWGRWVEYRGMAAGQSESGRLWDILNVFRFTAAGKRGRRWDFKVSAFENGGRGRTADLYAVCGPGDTAEPVITIMEVGED